MTNRRSINKTAAPPAPTFIDACNATFGSHPEDVIMPINSAAETLMQLHEIFKTISDDALDARHGHRIKALAEAGAYLAYDIGNFAGCEFERLRDSLVAAGVLSAEDSHVK
ncbi:MAG: hypothetical protein Q8J96_16460 [Rhodocyclaceae bacterium]|nr:hypothetical protein [Rhodocyclaceae bacterium]